MSVEQSDIKTKAQSENICVQSEVTLTDRVEQVKYICDNIMVIRDEHLKKIYPRIVELLGKKIDIDIDIVENEKNKDDVVENVIGEEDEDGDEDEKNKRIEKALRISRVKFIADNIKYYDDKTIDFIEKVLRESLSQKQYSKDKKLRIALEITNQILKKFGKEPIYDLCEFVGFTRENMLSEECKKVIEDNRKYIFDNGFNKGKCGVYQKKALANPHFSIFKGVINQAGYELCSKSKNTAVKKVRTVFTIYHIRKRV
jgi:hypothetical protein